MRYGAVLLLVWALGSPAVAGPALDRGIELYENGEYARAERSLRDALQAEPDSTAALHYLGLTLSHQGEYREAVGPLQRAVALDPEAPAIRLSLGVAYYRSGSSGLAILELERVVAAEPRNGSALLMLGLAHQAQRQDTQAVPYFERAAAADPDLAQLALYNAGLSCWRAEQPERAEVFLERSVRADPDSDTAADARDLLVAIDVPTQRKPFTITGRIGLEFDDNVTVPEVDASSGESDVATVFDLGAAYRIVDEPGSELIASYDFYQSLYADLSEANLQAHSFRLGGALFRGDADFGLGYRFTSSRLDGDDFLDVHALRPSLGISAHRNWYADIAYELQNRDFDDSERDAIRNELGIDNFLFFTPNRQGYVLLGYRVRTEDADGREFDYFGQVLRLGFETPLAFIGPRWALSARYEYLDRDYENVTPSIAEERHDRRHRAHLGVAWKLSRIGTARFSYEFLNSDSNLPEADYTQNVVRLSIGGKFDF